MENIDNIYEQLDKELSMNGADNLREIRRGALEKFRRTGIPTTRHEEWKYTRVSSLFNKQLNLPVSGSDLPFTREDLNALRLPAQAEANELVFINGLYSEAFSVIRSGGIEVLPLAIAAENEYAPIVKAHLGHSSKYHEDGLHALNTAWLRDGAFVAVKKAAVPEHPLYIINIADARTQHQFLQPRCLIHLAERAVLQVIDNNITIGNVDCLTSQVVEAVVEEAAFLEYYKLQHDAPNSSIVSTTHIRHIGKSNSHVVTISLDGKLVRNNLNIVLDAEHCESHMYGLYMPKGDDHIDNHTLVDNVKPHCFSNELYKGVMSDRSTGVFNGKIFVRQQAQKTNAYQSNKNILLSPDATVNTKPQLEIFADDVKCSHGCTIGQLDEDGIFYLRSRGISEDMARSLLLHGFATDILEQIKPVALRNYMEELINHRLELKDYEY